jgi:dTDP-D-glucose 4,6-dehydratase
MRSLASMLTLGQQNYSTPRLRVGLTPYTFAHADIVGQDATHMLFNRSRVDVLFVAGSDLDHSIRQRHDLIEINVDCTVPVLEAACAYGCSLPTCCRDDFRSRRATYDRVYRALAHFTDSQSYNWSYVIDASNEYERDWTSIKACHSGHARTARWCVNDEAWVIAIQSGDHCKANLTNKQAPV